MDASCTSIQLDTRGLDIDSILIDGEPAKDWKLAAEIHGKPHLGQRLTIPLAKDDSSSDTGKTASAPGGRALSPTRFLFYEAAKEVKLKISYTTSSDPEKCSAAQWLTPAQTSGKEYPYLFTQCQAIHARSIMPCYDCPAVKMTYAAVITVPKWATAVMSALPAKATSSENDDTDDDDGAHHTFSFDQPVPIPAYLLALAVGDLASKDLSPRCRIWSEPSTLKAAADEFHQTESFLQTAEEITSMPYAWQRYDLLVLPSSFPYGGMENPCLTFVTPTLLAGDGSLVSVVAHEIAHSWTGNLVTNKTWGHFWLNEGWTTWLQRRIMNRIENVPHDMDLDAIGGAQALENDISLLDKSMTSLYLKLGDNDPDESYSRVPYEKGFHLIYALERMVGQEIFLELVAGYLKKFAYGTVTSEEFKDFCISFWENSNRDAYMKVKNFEWDKWIYGAGMPALPKFNKALAEEAESLAAAWVDFDGKDDESNPPTSVIDTWTSGQKVCFLDSMLKLLQDDGKGTPKKFKISTLRLMQQSYGFHQSQNAEILFRYCMIAVQSEDKDIYPTVVRFITSQGRMKYVRPLYRAMFSSSDARDIAVETFLKNKDFYHPIASKMIAYDMTKGQSRSFMDKVKNVGFNFDSTQVAYAMAASAAIGALALMRSKK